jgi:hypothetical protein
LAGKVWHSDLNSDLKPLAACLADEANDRGDGIFPSIAYLAWKLSTSPRTVQRGMRDLRSMEVIKQVGSKKFGRVLVPIYRLFVSKLPYRPPWRFQQGDTDDVTPVSPRGADGVTKTLDGVTPVTRRGDRAVSPNPLEDPLERPVSQNLRPLTRPNPTAACGNLGPDDSEESQKPWLRKGKDQKKTAATPQQCRYANVDRLAKAAAEILHRKPDIPDGDLAEELKEWGAKEGVPYFDAWPGAATPIQQAITIARERRKTA